MDGWISRRRNRLLAGAAVLALVPLGPGVLAQLRQQPAASAQAVDGLPVEPGQAPPWEPPPDDGLNRFVIAVDDTGVAAGDEPSSRVPAPAHDGSGDDDPADAPAAGAAAGFEWQNDPDDPFHLPAADALSPADRLLLEQIASGGEADHGGGSAEGDGGGPPAQGAIVGAPGSGSPAQDVLDVLAQTPGVIEVEVVDGAYLSVVTTLTEEELAAIPGVGSVEVDGYRHPAAVDYLPYQWPLENRTTPTADIRWTEARTRATGAGAVVAVIDTGLEVSHPDLSGQLWRNAGEQCGNGVDDDGNGFVDDCSGWDFGYGDPDVGDGNVGHGTHVAGIVAADADGDMVTGVAPGARIMPLKVSGPYGMLVSDVTRAINYATANGADVINLSLGGPHSSSAEADAVNRAVAAGVTVVAAAGNEGRDITSSPFYPAALPGVVSVGSTDDTDAQSSFSNRSSVHVDLHAPGSQVLSSYPRHSAAYSSGTSMASPYVAGVAALVVERGASGTAVAQTILDTVAPRPGLAGMSVTGGRLDAAAAVGIPDGTDGRTAVRFGSLQDAVHGAEDEFTVTAVGLPSDVGEVALRATLARVHDGQVLGVTGYDFTAGAAAVTTSEAATATLATLTATGEDLTVPVAWTLPAGQYAVMVELLDSADQVIDVPALGTFQVAAPPGATPPGTGDGDDGGADPGTPPPGGSTDGGTDQPDDSVPPPSGGSGDGGDGDAAPLPEGPAPSDPSVPIGAPGINHGDGDPDDDGSSTPGQPGPGDGSSQPPPATDDGGGSGPDGGAGPDGGTDGGAGGGGAVGGDGGGPDGGAVPDDGSGADPDAGADGSDGSPGQPPADPDVPPSPPEEVVAGYVHPTAGYAGESALLTVPTGIPQGAYVHFGGTNATVLSTTATTATVITPAHQPQLVDVTVISPTGERFVIRDAFTYLQADGSPPPPDGGGGQDGGEGPDGDGGSGGDPTPGDGTTPPPGGSVPSPPEDGPSDPDGTQPEPGEPAPGPGTPDGSDGVAPPVWPLVIDGLTLNPLPSSSPLSRVSAASIASQLCQQEVCTGRRL